MVYEFVVLWPLMYVVRNDGGVVLYGVRVGVVLDDAMPIVHAVMVRRCSQRHALVNPGVQ